MAHSGTRRERGLRTERRGRLLVAWTAICFLRAMHGEGSLGTPDCELANDPPAGCGAAYGGRRSRASRRRRPSREPRWLGARGRASATRRSSSWAIQSEPMGGSSRRFTSSIRVAGDVVDDELIEPPHGSRVGFPQPWEKAIPGAGKGAREVDVAVEAIGDPAAQAALHAPRRRPTSCPGGRRSCASRSSRAASCIRRRPGARARSRARSAARRARRRRPASWAPASRRTCRRRASSPTRRTGRRTRPTGASRATAALPICRSAPGRPYYLPLTQGQVLQAEAGPARAATTSGSRRA